MSIRKVVSVSEAQWELAPAPAWWEDRPLDWAFVPPAGHPIACVLLDTQYHIASRTNAHRSVRKLLTMNAVQACAQVELDFDPSADRLVIHEVAVWREKNGTWQKRSMDDRSAFLLRQREQQLEQQMLDGRLSVVALLEDVRVGDAIELAWSLEPHDPLPGLRFTTFHAFGWTLPVAQACMTLHLDSAQPVKWRLHTGEGGWERTEEITGNRAFWQVKNPPMLEFEPNTPGQHWPCPILDVTGWETWGEVASYVAALWEDAMQEGTERVAEEATRLLAGNDPQKAARLAIRLVQEDVRYLAIDFGHGAGMIPNASETVLRRRFGDCKDKSVLLTALLRRLGFTAWPVLVASNWRGAVARVQPSTSAFSHVIVAFQVEGKTLFVDPTVIGQGGDWEHLCPPVFQCGLEIRDGVEWLVTIPERTVAELTLTETFELDRKGQGSTVLQELRGTGWMADQMRAAIVRADLEDFRKGRFEAFQTHFPAAAAGAQAPQVEDDFEKNVFVFRVSYLLPTWGPVGQNPPHMFVYGAHGLFLGMEAIEGPEHRKHPWALPFPVRIHHRLVVKGKCVRKTNPVDTVVTGPGFRYACKVFGEKRRAIFDYHWETSLPEIPAKQYSEYVQQRKKAFEQAGANVETPSFLARRSPAMIAYGVIGALFALGVLIGAIENRNKRPSAGRDQATITEGLSEARRAMDQRDFATAFYIYEALESRHQAGVDFHILHGLAAVEMGRLDRVRFCIQRIRGIDPKSDSADLLEARVLDAEGRRAEARDVLDKLLARKPGYPGALAAYARLSERAGDLPSAEVYWEKVLETRPPNTEALLRLAFIRWGRGEKEQADQLIVNAVRTPPTTNAVLESTLSQYYEATGRPKEASEAADRAVKLNRDSAYLRFRQILLILKNGDPKRAQAESREMAIRFPNVPTTYAAVALANAAAGDVSTADQAFQELLKLQPNDPIAHANYGRFLHQSGRHMDAKRVLAEATRRFPNSGLCWLNYADLLIGLGERAAAQAAQKRADELMSPAEKASLIR